MATRTNSVNDPTLLTSLGGTVNAADDVVVGYYGIDYTTGTLANDLLSFKLTPGFNGSFQASNGGQLVLVVNQTGTGRFINESNAKRVELNSTSSAGVIWQVEHRPALTGSVLQLNTCDTENLHIEGTVYVESAADVNSVFQYSGASFFRQTAAAATFPLGTVRLMGGTMELKRDCGNLDVSSAAVTMDSTHITAGTTNCWGGGTIVVMNGAPPTADVMTTLNLYDGVLDLRRIRVPLEIGTANFYPGGEIWVSKASANMLTINTQNNIAGGSRTRYFD